MMFEEYPKTRPPLPPEIEEIYVLHYKQNREGETAASWLSQRMERWLHRQVAKDLSRSKQKRATLEIGAGTLNQLQYEPTAEPYDIVEPFAELYENSGWLGRVRHIYADISEIPQGMKYDRITAIATFEHVCDLPYVVARSGLLLKPNGVLRVAIPSEGTPLWTMGWKVTTGLEFRIRYGLDYGLLLKHEHVNTASEIEEILRYYYKSVVSNVFGISKSLSLYQFFVCTSPDRERCT